MFSYIMDVKDNEMRIGPAIRYLATSNRRDVFLAALWTKTVYVWSFNKIGKIAEFDTIFDPGGIRLAIASSKDLFVAGAYFRYGVACYHLFTGDKLWHRKDIHRVQKIKISPNDKEVFCGFDDKPGQLLDLDTGVTIKKLRGVRDIEYDIYESCYVYDYVTKPLEVFNSSGHEVMKINKQTYAVVDLVFGPMHIALSEAGGPVRFISRKDPDKTVRYKPPDGQHVILLAYSPTKGAFFGVQLNYDFNYYSNVAPNSLLRFDPASDSPTLIAELPRSDYAFCDYGEHLIISDGLYMNTSTGEIDGKFDFPLTEYPH